MDKNCKGAAILIYKIKNNKIESLLRKRKYYPNRRIWSIPGSKMEDIDENDFKKTAIRECYEETGIKIKENILLIDEIRDNQFIWNTYLSQVHSSVENKFIEETLDSDWFNINNLPSPLVDLLQDQINSAKSIIKIK